PALALLIIATTWLASQRAKKLRVIGGTERIVSLAIIVAGLVPSTAALVTSHVSWFGGTISRIRLTQGVRPLVFAHPKVIAIARKYPFVPVARRLDGSYVGRTYFQIITLNVNEQLASRQVDAPTRMRLDAYARYDADRLASDIISTKPDVILIDGVYDRLWAM